MAEFRAEVQHQMIGYIIGAFGLVAGLAWNNAITALIEQIFPFESNTVIAKFMYAIVLTIFVVLLTRYLLKVFHNQISSNS